MFSGRDPEHNTYRGRAHLASMIAALGRPPVDLVARGQLSRKFFSGDGTCPIRPLPSGSLFLTLS